MDEPTAQHSSDDVRASSGERHKPAAAGPPQHGRHELPAKHHPVPAIGASSGKKPFGALGKDRPRLVFGALALLLCVLLGVAIATQVRQNASGDSLDTARPADLLVLLDSLRQREAALSTEVTELRRTLDSMRASGDSDQAAIENAQAKLAALSVLAGIVGATGPGVTVTIDDPGPGVTPEAMLDVINELRAAGAEAIEIHDGHHAVRVGVDTWVAGIPGGLIVDGITLSAPYTFLAIGDPPTLAAAMNIPGGAVDSVKRVAGRISVQQADKVDVTALRQPKPRQYARPVK